MTVAAANVEILRRGWNDAVSALAPNVDELPALLGVRLDQAVRDDQLGELALLAVVEEAGHLAFASMPPTAAGNLTRRLQRAVYEYLLSLDALTPEETEPASSELAAVSTASRLVGAEEVAALSGHAAEPALRVIPTPEAAAPPAAMPSPEAPNGAVEPEAEAAVAAELQPEAEAEPALAPLADENSHPEQVDDADGDDHARRPRFTLFRRSAPEPEGEPAEPAAIEPAAAVERAPAPDPAPVAPPPQPAGIRIEEPAAARPAAAPPPPARPVIPLKRDVTHVPELPAAQVFEPVAPAGGVPFVAPRDGFHLSDIDDLTRAEAAAADVDIRPSETEAEEEPSGKGWHVRDQRPERYTRRRPVSTVLTAAGEVEPEDTSEHDAETQNRFDFEPAIVELRQQIRDRLQRRKLDEAAALLQKLATDLGGRAVAELALDAGDRCRALGKSNAALSCYLAGTRADPVYEAPLLRLADICLDDQDIELAASYLERVARILRLRGDDKGALRIYRKLATIAPFREDIISVLMRAQTSGRFED